MTAHVLIVDDERNVRKAYKADIASAPNRYELVDAIGNAADAELICQWKPVDLILMDVNTAHNESGLAAAETIKRRFPGVKIIMTTSYLDARAVEKAQSIGVESFWFKDFSRMELLDVMDQTMRGERCYPECMPPVSLGDALLNDFSPTEMQVLYLCLLYTSRCV